MPSIFLKRQWILGKRFGFVTPGEMLGTYFQGDFIRILTVIVALLYSIPYLGVQLGASGYLFNVITVTEGFPDGMFTQNVGMWILSIVVFIYVASGGLRAVAYVDTLPTLTRIVNLEIRVSVRRLPVVAFPGRDKQPGPTKASARKLGWAPKKGDAVYGSENLVVVRICGALLGLLHLLGLEERTNGEDGQRLLHRWPKAFHVGVYPGGNCHVVFGLDLHGPPGTGVP